MGENECLFQFEPFVLLKVKKKNQIQVENSIYNLSKPESDTEGDAYEQKPRQQQTG